MLRRWEQMLEDPDVVMNIVREAMSVKTNPAKVARVMGGRMGSKPRAKVVVKLPITLSEGSYVASTSS